MRGVPPDGLIRHLSAADNFVIVGHVDPDPDSIGSTLALGRMLAGLGKRCVPVTPTPIPPLLDFMPGAEALVSAEEVTFTGHEHLIVLDCGLERTGAVSQQAGLARSVVNIDHHATNRGTGTFNWIDTDFAATAEMIAALGRALGAPVDRATATLLYAGLVGDTGWFRFSNTTPEVLRLAASLLEYGVDPDYMNRVMNERRSFAYLLLLGRMLQSVRLACRGRVVVARVTQQMRREVGADQTEGEGYVQYLRLVRDTDVAVLLDETLEGQIRVQLRSSPRVDVAAIARSLGGGGHARAAGVRLEGSIGEVEELVLERVGAALEDPSKESEPFAGSD